jgi:purine-binding chemotaxis protein CheW
MRGTAASAPPLAQTTQFLAFSLGDAQYGIELLRVREILEFSSPTRVPGTPPFIRGVINLRGNVVPIVDLHVKLGLPKEAETKRACFAIVEVGGEWGEPVRLGLIVDEVTDIIELGAADIESPPPFGTKIRLDFLRGVGNAGGRLYLVLEIDRVLSPVELSAVEEAASEAQAPE